MVYHLGQKYQRLLSGFYAQQVKGRGSMGISVSRSQVISDLNIPKTHLSPCFKHVCRRLQVRLGIPIMTGPDIGRYCARGHTAGGTACAECGTQLSSLWRRWQSQKSSEAQWRQLLRSVQWLGKQIPSDPKWIECVLRSALRQLFVVFLDVLLNVVNIQNTWLHVFIH